MRSSERTIKRLGEIIAGDEAVSEDPGRLPGTDLKLLPDCQQHPWNPEIPAR
jgi:hypothetical protein